MFLEYPPLFQAKHSVKVITDGSGEEPLCSVFAAVSTNGVCVLVRFWPISLSLSLGVFLIMADSHILKLGGNKKWFGVGFFVCLFGF